MNRRLKAIWRGNPLNQTHETVQTNQAISPLWTDSVTVPKDAKNVENAKLFQNFIMAPDNAALTSNSNRYNNGIIGSAEYMDHSLKNAPDLFASAELLSHGIFTIPCSPEAQTICNKI